ncbi:hypothetical protein JB92DRAFT_1794515 [Gautieria morchelliformis]|nr:hypothetical protein JB92DRAFT_1794515 [Gautieria morchelliformis]
MFPKLPMCRKTSRSSIHILTIWAVDRPDHSDAAILNQKVLDTHYCSIWESFFSFWAIATTVAYESQTQSSSMAPSAKNSSTMDQFLLTRHVTWSCWPIQVVPPAM